MRQRTLGRTGILVTELGLGTWGLAGDGYGEVREDEQDAVIDRALAFGINLFETADVYGGGKMERKLGERLPNDDSCVVVTKLGTDLESRPKRKRFEPSYLEETLARSRERLGRQRPDVVLLHNPSVEVMRRGEAADWLQGLVDAGQLRAWGLSAGNKEVVFAALEHQAKPHVVELPFNVFCSLDARAVSNDLKERGVGLLARSVLAHGLLAGQWPVDKTFPPEDHRSQRWTRDQLRRRIHQLKALRVLNSGNRTPSMRAGAIGYVLDEETVTAAILGPRSAVQLDQLVRETAKEPPYLEPRARQQLDDELMRLRVQ